MANTRSRIIKLIPDYFGVETKVNNIAKKLRWFRAKDFKYNKHISYVELKQEGMLWKLKSMR